MLTDRLIFLGFALDKTDKLGDALAAYEEAAGVKPGDAQAWQGMIKVFERQGAAADLAKYKAAALRLAAIFRDADDLYRCQGVVDTFVGFARRFFSGDGKTAQLVDALGILLPDSPLYAALAGRVPRPAATYETLAGLVEADDRRRINTLIGERRTRLGARLVDVTAETKTEVFAASPLAQLYAAVIDWTGDDELRRAYEEKLLAYRIERLAAFPAGSPEKARELGDVQTLARGMVIIKHAFQPAWDIVVDWADHADLGDWDAALLWEYRTLFPTTGLGKALSGFLTSDMSPFPESAKPEDKDVGEEDEQGDETAVEAEEDAETGVREDAKTKSKSKSTQKKPRRVPLPTTNEQRLSLVVEGVAESKSFLACRMLGLWYQQAEAHRDSIELMRQALKQLGERRASTGMPFQHTEDALTVFLATALLAYQTPRNHAEAKRLFEGVLTHNAASKPALVGIGLIHVDETDYEAAAPFLERALAQDRDDLRVRSETAWVHTLQGRYGEARDQLESCIGPLAERMQANQGRALRRAQAAQRLLALTEYRLGVCVWEMDASKAARRDRGGAYRHFLTALKHDLTLAPAYTRLGVFYADYGKDRKRAFKCFMKALELSDAELEAGRRLVQTFADQRDWDSIALVAQRVVDSGQATPPWGSRRPAHGWPFAALGTAQLHRKEYNAAMMSFRMATRLAPGDYHSFVALAETYLRARMHYSAVRAIEKADGIRAADPGSTRGYDTWLTDYLLGNVYRGVGEHDKAIALYEAILAARPGEQGVLIALMHAMVESAETCVKTGLFGEAVAKAGDTLAFAGRVPAATAEATFGFWTAVAGACAIFSTVQGRVTAFPAAAVAQLVTMGCTSEGSEDAKPVDNHPAYAFLQDIDHVGTGVVRAEGRFAADETVGVALTRSLQATILAYKRALHVAPADDAHLRAVAHYNLGWAEFRAHRCLPEELRDGGALTSYLRGAIRCFKRAIELEAGNRRFWNALGVAASAVHAPVAQHALVRSLYLGRGRQAPVWANLGALALLHGDAELANHAFAEGQAADPDCGASWLGQGFVALRFGEAAEARSLFLHAVDLSDAASPASVAARQQYALAVFDHLVDQADQADNGRAVASPTDLARPLLGLEQVRRLRPEALPYAHLFALFRERIHDRESTAPLLAAVCAALEADYEATESPAALRRIVVAKADLARAHVAMGAYGDAVACAEMVLQLVGEEGEEGDESGHVLPPAARRKVQLSAHLAAGLARFFSGDFDAAVADFEAVLGVGANDTRNPDAVCLFAQVLWATGTDDARQRAQDELFAVIDAHPDHLQAVLLLGVVALLNGDAESAEAVAAELEATQLSSPSSPADQARIGAVLHALANPERDAGGAPQRAARSQAQRDVVLHPYLPHGWTNLGEEEADVADVADVADDDDGANFATDMALRLTLSLLPPRGTLGAEDLAAACVGTRRPADAQVAAVVAPWLADGWQALAEAVS